MVFAVPGKGKQTLKALTEKQIDALAELMSMDLETSKAWRIKEMLRWVRQAPIPSEAPNGG